MVNRILLAAILCAGASAGSLPMSVAVADDAATTATPALDLADPPASDDDLKKESGSAVQSAGGNAGGMMLPTSTDQAVGAAPSFSNGGSSTISTNNSLTSVSTLSATINSNGFQN
jgi:hypothetical protein